MPLKMHVSLGSPLGRAPAVAGERVVVATICPLRRLRRHLSHRERLFVSPIISQNRQRKQYLCRNLLVYLIRNLLRYGINPKGKYTLRVMPYACGDCILAYARLHTSPSDWIEKSKSFDLLFSCGHSIKMQLFTYSSKNTSLIASRYPYPYRSSGSR